ncbi:phage tail protein [Pedobacter punctiformis]|uniref:Phage tail protein n=1 Tax=Pedobacter punctiformis TaxID=3004097 RepID=A0ABT4LAQ2_9SPHI|nr:phage tail protein [Pedobacter sp. HCMS5-2]MCZ4244984.1 phage tail protein [Pedobacter sp. HCMS5-2]
MGRILSVYKYNGTLRATVHPDESSGEVCDIMGQDIFQMGITVPVPIFFEYGDYVMVNGRKFRLNTPPNPITKNAERDYEYKLTFESDLQQIGKAAFLFLDSTNRFTEPVFPITGNAIDFLQLLVANLNRLYPDYNYVIGYVVDSDTVTIDFENNNCLEALNILAEKFETEWHVVGNKISLYKRIINSGVVLKYGKEEALYQLSIAPQTNANPITRVYGFGSDRNIGSNYRNGSRRLRMADKLYLDKNTGLSDGTGKYDVVEVVKIFEDIYPRRNGTVTSVTTPFVFADSGMDFNVNSQLIPGVEAKVEFISGQLSGNSFTISDYNNATKTFTINKNTEDQTIDIPSELLSPAIGDKYVLINILMPDQYIINAEAELKQAVKDYLDSVSGDVQISFNAVCNPLYFKVTGHTVSLGQVVSVVDTKLNINRQIRIIGYTRNWIYPYLYTLSLADSVKDKSLIKLINT